MDKTKILILNAPSPENAYINRDQMGGMGQMINFGKSFQTKLLSKLKSNFIHLPVVQLVYAATILDEADFDVKVVDALNEHINVEDTLNLVKNFDPKFVIMSVCSSGLLFERNVIAKGIKDVCPDSKVITVGDTVAHVMDQFKPPFDIGIAGEVERVILDICKGKDLNEIDGIMFFKDGKLIYRMEKAFLQNEELDKLPFPNWDLFPYHRYVYYPLLKEAPVATLQSTRGCPYGCGYCSYPVNQGLRWRSRSAENVFSEIENNVKKYSFKGIVFRDPLFTLDQRRIDKLCDLILENNIKIVFAFETRPELLTKPLLDKLYKAGCRGINFGVEDIHPEILKTIKRKPIDKEKIVEIVTHAEKLGIRTTCFFIIGLPGSTKESIKETLDFSLQLDLSHADYKIATPYPGTYLHQLGKMNNWIRKEGYNKLSGYSATMQISDELPPEYLEKVCDEAFKKFYLRPKYFLRELKKGEVSKKSNIVLKSLFH